MKATFLRLLVMLASKEAEGLSSLVSSSCELLRIEQWYLGKCKWYFVPGVWGPEELERQCVLSEVLECSGCVNLGG